MTKKNTKEQTLPQWMKSKGLDDEAVAEMVKRARSSVSKYRRGKMLPDYELMLQFEKVSRGSVSLKSWDRLQKSAARAAAKKQEA